MKQIKRMAVLLIAAALLILTPMSALAARQEYVPTKVIYYEFKDGNWIASYEETYSYTKNGRIKSVMYKSFIYGETTQTVYTWKGDFLKKEESPGDAITYSYKKKKLKSTTNVNKYFNKVTTGSVSWKKRKGTITRSDGTTGSFTVNKRNQVIKNTQVGSHGNTSTTTIKYFSNGNVKSRSTTADGLSSVMKFNRKGYPISYKSSSGEETYKYTKNKKGQITQQLITYTSKGGKVYNYKREYSGWKKLSRSVRNCDAFGNPVITPYSD